MRDVLGWRPGGDLSGFQAALTEAFHTKPGLTRFLPATLSGPHSNALVDMVHNSGPTALTVLGILLIASIVSWAIIIAKWRAFNEANVQSKRFLRAFLERFVGGQHHRMRA